MKFYVYQNVNVTKYASQKIQNQRHQMRSFKLQMHQNPFSAGDRPRTSLGSLRRSPDP